MDVKQTAVLAVVGGTLVTLLARASTSIGPPGNSSSQSVPPVAEPTPLMTEINRLRDRLRAPIAPAAPARNLFEFRHSAPPVSPAGATKPADVVSTTAPIRPLPALRLLGLAEDQGPDGPVRTAILSSAGSLLFVKTGDTVTGGLRVTAIRGDAVELTGAANQPPLVLELK